MEKQPKTLHEELKDYYGIYLVWRGICVILISFSTPWSWQKFQRVEKGKKAAMVNWESRMSCIKAEICIRAEHWGRLTGFNFFGFPGGKNTFPLSIETWEHNKCMIKSNEKKQLPKKGNNSAASSYTPRMHTPFSLMKQVCHWGRRYKSLRDKSSKGRESGQVGSLVLCCSSLSSAAILYSF